MGASSSRPSTTSREVAFRSTEKRQHGNPQLKASGEVAPTRCTVARDCPRTWTRPPHSSAGGTPMCGQFGSSPTSNGGFPRFRGGCSEERVVEGKASSRTRPLKEQLAQNDSFIQQKRIAPLERERTEEQALLDKALVWQERLKQEVAAANQCPRRSLCRSRARRCCSSGRRWPSWKRNESRIQSEGPSTPQRVCGRD